VTNSEQDIALILCEMLTGRGVERAFPGDSIDQKRFPCVTVNVQRGEPDPPKTDCYTYSAEIIARGRTPNEMASVAMAVESLIPTDVVDGIKAPGTFWCYDAEFTGSTSADTDKLRGYSRTIDLWIKDLRSNN